MGGAMNAPQLLTDLTRLGIQLEAHGDGLRYSPRSAVTPYLVERIKTHKPALLAILRYEAHPCADCGCAIGWRNEKGVICGNCHSQPERSEKVVLIDDPSGGRWRNYDDELAEHRALLVTDLDGTACPETNAKGDR